jgi:hypothetical protein
MALQLLTNLESSAQQGLVTVIGNLFTRTGLCNPQNPRDTFIQEPSMHALGAVFFGSSL